jgi:hypothetical protein
LADCTTGAPQDVERELKAGPRRDPRELDVERAALLVGQLEELPVDAVAAGIRDDARRLSFAVLERDRLRALLLGVVAAAGVLRDVVRARQRGAERCEDEPDETALPRSTAHQVPEHGPGVTPIGG